MTIYHKNSFGSRLVDTPVVPLPSIYVTGEMGERQCEKEVRKKEEKREMDL